MATKSVGKKAVVSAVPSAQVYTRINSLLYTLRNIAQREDQLCTLMHHLRTTGKLNATSTAELHAILDEIPLHEYFQDVEALRASLGELESSAPATKASGTRPRGTGKRRAA